MSTSPGVPDPAPNQDIVIEVGVDLTEEARRLTALTEAIRERLCRHGGQRFGSASVVVDRSLAAEEYVIRLAGGIIARGEVRAGHLLAIATRTHHEAALRQLGELIVPDPVFSLPGTWIRPQFAERARDRNLTVAGPAEVIASHAEEALSQHRAGS